MEPDSEAGPRPPWADEPTGRREPEHPAQEATVLSTIAVHSGASRIVIALLQNKEWVGLRALEMTPGLHHVAATLEEALLLQEQHQTLVDKLVSNESPAEDLLSRADSLVASRGDKAETYAAMASSLAVAWQELHGKLEMRRKLLQQSVTFHRRSQRFSDMMELAEREFGAVHLPSTPEEARCDIRRLDDVRKGVLEASLLTLQEGALLLEKLRQMSTRGAVDSRPHHLRAKLKNSSGQVERWLEEQHDRRRCVDVLFTNRRLILDQCLVLLTLYADLDGLEWEARRWVEEAGSRHELGDSASAADILLAEHAKVETNAKTLRDRGLALLRSAEQLVTAGTYARERPRTRAYATLDLCAQLTSSAERRSQLLRAAADFFTHAQQASDRLLLLEGGLQSAPASQQAAVLEEVSAELESSVAPALSRGQAVLEEAGTDGTEGVSVVMDRLRYSLEALLDRCKAAKQRQQQQSRACSELIDKYNRLLEWLESAVDSVLRQQTDVGVTLDEASQFVTVHEELKHEFMSREPEVSSALSEYAALTPGLDSPQLVDQLVPPYNTLRSRSTSLLQILDWRLELGSGCARCHQLASQLSADLRQLVQQLPTSGAISDELTRTVEDRWRHLGQLHHQLSGCVQTFIHKCAQSRDPYLRLERSRDRVAELLSELEMSHVTVTRQYEEVQLRTSTIKRVRRHQERCRRDIEKVDSSLSALRSQLYPLLPGDGRPSSERARQCRQRAEQVLPSLQAALSQLRHLATQAERTERGVDDVSGSSLAEELRRKTDDLAEDIEDYQSVVQMVVTLLKKLSDLSMAAQKRRDAALSRPTPADPEQCRKALTEHETAQQAFQELVSLAEESLDRVCEKLRQAAPPAAAEHDCAQLRQALLTETADWQQWQQQRQQQLLSQLHTAEFSSELSAVGSQLAELRDQLSAARGQYGSSRTEAEQTREAFSTFEDTIQVTGGRISDFITAAESPDSPESDSRRTQLRHLEHCWQALQKQVRDIRHLMDLAVEYYTLLELSEEWTRQGSHQLVDLARDVSNIRTAAEARALQARTAEFLTKAQQEQTHRLDDVTAMANQLYGPTKPARVTTVTQETQDLLDSMTSIRQHLKLLETQLTQREQPVEMIEDEQQRTPVKPASSEQQRTPAQAAPRADASTETNGHHKPLTVDSATQNEATLRSDASTQDHVARHVDASTQDHVARHVDASTQDHVARHVDASTQDHIIAHADASTQDHRVAVVDSSTQKTQSWQESIIRETVLKSQQSTLFERDQRPPAPAPPVFIEQLTDQTVQSGVRHTLQTRVSGIPAPEVTWWRDGGQLLPATDCVQHQQQGVCSLTIDDTRPDHSAVYSCRATNLAGAAETRARIIVRESSPVEEPSPPRFSRHLNSVRVPADRPCLLTTEVTGHPLPVVSWSMDGICVDDSAEYVITYNNGACALRIAAAEPQHQGRYTCKAANQLGTASTSAQLSVESARVSVDRSSNGDAPELLTPLRDVRGRTGDTLKLETQLRAIPPPDLTWLKDGRPLRAECKATFDGRRATLVIPEATENDVGTYTLTARNGAGETATACCVAVQEPTPGDSSESSPPPPPPPQRDRSADTAAATVATAAPLAAAGLSRTLSLRRRRPPSFVQIFTDQAMTAGQEAVFECLIDGRPQYTVQWLWEDSALLPAEFVTRADSGRHQLHVRSAHPELSGQIKCIAENELGRATCEARLTVVDPEEEEISSRHPHHHHQRTVCKKTIISETHEETEVSLPAVRLAPGTSAMEEGERSSDTEGEKQEAAEEQKQVARVQPPRFTEPLPGLVVQEGEDVVMTGAYTGTADISWLRDSKPLPPDSRAVTSHDDVTITLKLTSAEESDAGDYTCLLKNSAGSSRSTAELLVKKAQVAPWFERRLEAQVARLGQPATMQVVVGGTPTPTVTWGKDGRPLTSDDRVTVAADQGTHTLTLHNVELSDGGQYSVCAENDAGETTNIADFLVMEKLPAVVEKRVISTDLSDGEPASPTGGQKTIITTTTTTQRDVRSRTPSPESRPTSPEKRPPGRKSKRTKVTKTVVETTETVKSDESGDEKSADNYEPEVSEVPESEAQPVKRTQRSEQSKTVREETEETVRRGRESEESSPPPESESEEPAETEEEEDKIPSRELSPSSASTEPREEKPELVEDGAVTVVNVKLSEDTAKVDVTENEVPEDKPVEEPGDVRDDKDETPAEPVDEELPADEADISTNVEVVEPVEETPSREDVPAEESVVEVPLEAEEPQKIEHEPQTELLEDAVPDSVDAPKDQMEAEGVTVLEAESPPPEPSEIPEAPRETRESVELAVGESPERPAESAGLEIMDQNSRVLESAPVVTEPEVGKTEQPETPVSPSDEPVEVEVEDEAAGESEPPAAKDVGDAQEPPEKPQEEDVMRADAPVPNEAPVEVHEKVTDGEVEPLLETSPVVAEPPAAAVEPPPSLAEEPPSSLPEEPPPSLPEEPPVVTQQTAELAPERPLPAAAEMLVHADTQQMYQFTAPPGDGGPKTPPLPLPKPAPQIVSKPAAQPSPQPAPQPPPKPAPQPPQLLPKPAPHTPPPPPKPAPRAPQPPPKPMPPLALQPATQWAPQSPSQPPPKPVSMTAPRPTFVAQPPRPEPCVPGPVPCVLPAEVPPHPAPVAPVQFHVPVVRPYAELCQQRQLSPQPPTQPPQVLPPAQPLPKLIQRPQAPPQPLPKPIPRPQPPPQFPPQPPPRPQKWPEAQPYHAAPETNGDIAPPWASTPSSQPETPLSDGDQDSAVPRWIYHRLPPPKKLTTAPVRAPRISERPEAPQRSLSLPRSPVPTSPDVRDAVQSPLRGAVEKMEEQYSSSRMAQDYVSSVQAPVSPVRTPVSPTPKSPEWAPAISPYRGDVTSGTSSEDCYTSGFSSISGQTEQHSSRQTARQVQGSEPVWVPGPTRKVVTYVSKTLPARHWRYPEQQVEDTWTSSQTETWNARMEQWQQQYHKHDQVDEARRAIDEHYHLQNKPLPVTQVSAFKPVKPTPLPKPIPLPKPAPLPESTPVRRAPPPRPARHAPMPGKFRPGRFSESPHSDAGERLPTRWQPDGYEYIDRRRILVHLPDARPQQRSGRPVTPPSVFDRPAPVRDTPPDRPDVRAEAFWLLRGRSLTRESRAGMRATSAPPPQLRQTRSPTPGRRGPAQPSSQERAQTQAAWQRRQLTTERKEQRQPSPVPTPVRYHTDETVSQQQQQKLQQQQQQKLQQQQQQKLQQQKQLQQQQQQQLLLQQRKQTQQYRPVPPPKPRPLTPQPQQQSSLTSQTRHSSSLSQQSDSSRRDLASQWTGRGDRQLSPAVGREAVPSIGAGADRQAEFDKREFRESLDGPGVEGFRAGAHTQSRTFDRQQTDGGVSTRSCDERTASTTMERRQVLGLVGVTDRTSSLALPAPQSWSQRQARPSTPLSIRSLSPSPLPGRAGSSQRETSRLSQVSGTSTSAAGSVKSPSSLPGSSGAGVSLDGLERQWTELLGSGWKSGVTSPGVTSADQLSRQQTQEDRQQMSNQRQQSERSQQVADGSTTTTTTTTKEEFHTQKVVREIRSYGVLPPDMSSLSCGPTPAIEAAPSRVWAGAAGQ